MTVWVPYDAHPWEARTAYWVRSRNLTLAVPVANDEWIGIREKFGVRFLSTERVTNVWLEPVAVVPEPIRLTTRVGKTFCEYCGEEALWTGPPAPAPWVCGGECPEPRPSHLANLPLHEFLVDLEDPGIIASQGT